MLQLKLYLAALTHTHVWYWPGTKKMRVCIRLDVNGYLSGFESTHLIAEQNGVVGQSILEVLLSHHLHVVEFLPV